ncbi:MAG: putative metal-binding motif-containing protein [Alphaproteobacteria bacterium]|nr:putative metal-binding motif-containing protein [Alphaproteobacteria bacterium]
MRRWMLIAIVSSGCNWIPESRELERYDGDGDGVLYTDDCNDADAGARNEVIGFRDGDGDGVGSDVTGTFCEVLPEGWSATPGDCDDANPDAVEATLWYPDADGDGYGADDAATSACGRPGPTFVADSSDCDDTRADVGPHVVEVCDADDVDEDCNGLADDADPSVDRDTFTLFFPDGDSDGFGNATDLSALYDGCDAPTGYVPAPASPDQYDCDDGVFATNPNGTEICDGVDNDCNGQIDEYADAAGVGAYHVDADEDGWADDLAQVDRCADADSTTDGFVLVADFAVTATAASYDPATAPIDCDPLDPTVNPGVSEIAYNGVDNDCSNEDGTVEDDWDQDGDGFVPSVLPLGAAPYAGALPGGDCQDDPSLVGPASLPAAMIHPGQSDTPYDGVDQDCDGSHEYDVDGDGFAPDGYTGVAGLPGGDCDDLDATVSPVAVDPPYDGTDSNCDGADDFDVDGDGQAPVAYGGTDCDDDDPTVFEGAPDPLFDGVDSDCTGNDDYDGDGDGEAGLDWGGPDCNDADPAVFTGAPELCDAIDHDCDGSISTPGLVTLWDRVTGAPVNTPFTGAIDVSSVGRIDICGGTHDVALTSSSDAGVLEITGFDGAVLAPSATFLTFAGGSSNATAPYFLLQDLAVEGSGTTQALVRITNPGNSAQVGLELVGMAFSGMRGPTVHASNTLVVGNALVWESSNTTSDLSVSNGVLTLVASEFRAGLYTEAPITLTNTDVLLKAVTAAQNIGGQAGLMDLLATDPVQGVSALVQALDASENAGGVAGVLVAEATTGSVELEVQSGTAADNIGVTGGAIAIFDGSLILGRESGSNPREPLPNPSDEVPLDAAAPGGTVLDRPPELVAERNSASAGGAVYVDGGSADVSNVDFRANLSDGDGGAVVLLGGAVLQSDDTIYEANVSLAAGGAVRVVDSVGLFTNDSFRENVALGGGAVSAANGATVAMTAGLCIGNTATRGGALEVLDAAGGMNSIGVESNHADSAGGAVWVQGAAATFVANKASLRDNTIGTGPTLQQNDVSLFVGGNQPVQRTVAILACSQDACLSL